MSFHAQLLRDLDLGNDVSGHDYRSYATSSRPSKTHYRNESTPWWKATLHFTGPVLLIVVGIIYTLLHAYGLTWQSLPDLLWNHIVHFTPYKLVVIFDKEAQAASLGVSKFSTTVSHAEKSAMMRRIIGLDAPGGILSSVSQAGRRRLSSIAGLNLRGGGCEESASPAGLGNWDNSCYQNSVLQGLSSLNGFDTYLLGPYAQDSDSDAHSSDSERTIRDESPGAEMQMANSLYNLIQKLNDPANNGNRLWTPSALKSMSSWQQQDAQEYFSRIVDEIDREIERAARLKDPHIQGFPSVLKPGKLSYYGGRAWPGFKPEIRNPLEGLLAQRVACTFCSYSDGLQMVPFTTLTLSLPPHPNQRVGVPYLLSDLLDGYTKLEFIDDVHCGRCTLLGKRQDILWMLKQNPNLPKSSRPAGIKNLKDVVEALQDDDYETKTLKEKCKVIDRHMTDSTKSKQVVIARPPKSLVVHINRSMFDEYTGELSKNHAPVKFEEELDLGPWTLGSASRPGTSVNGVEGPDEEDWTTNPVRSMISRGTPDRPGGANQLRNALAINHGWNGGRMVPELPPKKSLVRGPGYKLKAVVVHVGRHENGHYITYKRYPVRVSPSPVSSPISSPPSVSSDDVDCVHVEVTGIDPSDTSSSSSSKIPEFKDEWFRISDDDVLQVSADEVFSSYAQQGAFMLFYDQISPALRVDAVPNPADAAAWPIPATLPDEECPGVEVGVGDLKVAKLLDAYLDLEVDDTSERAWMAELDILSADGTSERGAEVGSPDTAICDSPSPESVDTAIYNPRPKTAADVDWDVVKRLALARMPTKAEKNLDEILGRTTAALTPPPTAASLITPPAMPLRPGNAQNTVLSGIDTQSPLAEASDSELTSTTSTAMSSPQMKPLDPVVPIVVKSYAPKTGTNSEMTERGGGRRRRKGRKVGGVGLLMV